MKVYLKNINSITDDDIAEVAGLLPQRYEKSMKYRLKEGRLCSIGAGLFMIRNLNLTDESLIRYSEHEKPYLENGPEFNISHSGEYVAFVQANAPVGVDIEIIKEKNTSISKRMFGEELDCDGFHINWTRRESAMKAKGVGFSQSDKSVEDGLFWRYTKFENYYISVSCEQEFDDLELVIV